MKTQAVKTAIEVQEEFQQIPGVGPIIAAELFDLGVCGLDGSGGALSGASLPGTDRFAPC